MFTITAEYIIMFNITHVPIYARYGPLIGGIPNMCHLTRPHSTMRRPNHLSIQGHAGNGSPISPVHVQLPNVVHDK